MNYIINTTTDVLSNTAGIALASRIFSKIGLDLPDETRISQPQKSVLKTMAGLIVQGRTCYAEVDLFREDLLFKQALDMKFVYAPETIRIYLDRLAKQLPDHTLSVLGEVNQNLLKKVSFSPIETEVSRYVPVDIDVSPMDNSRTRKEGVGRTYKGFDGYAPIFAYIGNEGYMLDCQMRPGKQHCQKDTPDFLEGILASLEDLSLEEIVLIRLDSGNDAIDTLVPLMKSGHFFLVKRNLRRESPEKWLDIAESMGKREDPREGKIVYTGVLTSSHPKAREEDGLPDIDQVYRVTVRTIDRTGTVLLFPEIEVEVYWTNLPEAPETVIGLYHDHGTSEQFHSELKSDMDVERFPSGKLAVNAILLHLAMIAFNTLRFIGQRAMEYPQDLPYRHRGKRKRLRKVISDLIRVSCKVVFHANRWILRLWEDDPWLKIFQKLYQEF